MTTLTPTISLFSAWEAALNAQLSTLLGFPFNYPALRTVPSDSPRGFATITAIAPRTASNSLQSVITVQVRVCVASSGDAIAGHWALKDWAVALRDCLAVIGDTGITGTFRNTAVSRAWAGMRSVEPYRFVVEDTPQVQDSGEAFFHGLILTSYQAFLSESDFEF